MTDNIKELYVKVKDKDRVRIAIADKYDLSENSVASNWLSRGWIPEQHQEGVLDILQKQIKIESK